MTVGEGLAPPEKIKGHPRVSFVLCLVTVLDDIVYTMVVFVTISPRDLSDAKSIINSTG